MHDENFLTITETAERAGVSEAAVRVWVAQGKLDAYRRGPGTRRLLILRADLEDFLTPRRVEPRSVSAVGS